MVKDQGPTKAHKLKSKHMIKIDQKAPNFTLPRDGGSKVSLQDFKGKWVIIYFYPKDLTPGCTTQAIDFTDQFDEFQKRDAVIIGISPDSVASHDKFIQKHQLNVILAADEERNVIESYDVWKEKKMFARTYMGVERSTFLVDRDGTIKAIWRKVKVKGHADALLKKIDEENEKRQ